jgi:hypothetical protein
VPEQVSRNNYNAVVSSVANGAEHGGAVRKSKNTTNSSV